MDPTVCIFYPNLKQNLYRRISVDPMQVAKVFSLISSLVLAVIYHADPEAKST